MQSSRQKFIETIKKDANYRKFIKRDIIDLLTEYFNDTYKKEKYMKSIANPLELALSFYKQYNAEYYKIIVDGISNDDIVISCKEDKSFVDCDTNKAFIKLNDNDSDAFMFVHEFAHFIDRTSNPKIISDDCWFLSETFAFYFEKMFEKYLEDREYKDLIHARRNNRIFFESKMICAINNQLYYEDLYNKKGNIDEQDIDVEKMNTILRYDIDENIVNYLLQYPLANVISEYLISNRVVKKEGKFVEYCLNLDLYDLLEKNNMTNNIFADVTNRKM